MLLGVIELSEAKRIRSVLEEWGIALELKHNPDTCASAGSPGGRCATTVEVHFDEKDLAQVQEFFKREKQRDMGDIEIDPVQLAQVYDPEKEDAVCPACGTSFKTTAKECPDCGLVVAPDLPPTDESEPESAT